MHSRSKPSRPIPNLQVLDKNTFPNSNAEGDKDKNMILMVRDINSR
jgi:hypothetical protein